MVGLHLLPRRSLENTYYRVNLRILTNGKPRNGVERLPYVDFRLIVPPAVWRGWLGSTLRAATNRTAVSGMPNRSSLYLT